MITTYYTKSSAFEAQITLEALLKQLPEHFSARALRYQFPEDAYNFILGRLMLKKALKTLGLPVECLNKMTYNEEGKPLIEGISFSISHSQDLVACAFSATGNIGLDVEFPRDITRTHFRHCFNDQEWALIQNDESRHTFYQYWTQKEAILKANGVGLAHLLAIDIKNPTLAHFYNKETLIQTTWNLKAMNLGDSLAYVCLCTDLEVEVSLEELKTVESLV
ncbi:MAG: 4'-phosphopantetheinyl transferase [Aureispira sp.]|jgi:4'-phosphopantetheinyl transferase